jgi:hypothetical protein
VCLLTLKHLVSLQDRTDTSVQNEVDLYTKEKEKQKCCICSIERLPSEETPRNRFFVFCFNEVVCTDTYYRSVDVCALLFFTSLHT